MAKKKEEVEIHVIKVNSPKVRKASKVMGILSICLFFLTWPGMILGIIGLCLKKDEEHRTRDIALNTIGLILSTIWFLYIMGTL